MTALLGGLESSLRRIDFKHSEFFEVDTHGGVDDSCARGGTNCEKNRAHGIESVLLERIPCQDGVSKSDLVLEGGVERSCFKPVETSKATSSGRSGDRDGGFDWPDDVRVRAEK